MKTMHSKYTLLFKSIWGTIPYYVFIRIIKRLIMRQFTEDFREFTKTFVVSPVCHSSM